jgi:hypothetical protein
MIKLQTLNPGLTKVELNQGAKVGAVSGVISGAVFSPLVFVVSWVIGWLTFPALWQPIEPGAMYWSFEEMVAHHFLSPYFLTQTIPSIIFGAVAGLLFGSLFIVLYEKLPGKTPTMKGIVTAIIHWAAAYLIFPLLVPFIMGWYPRYPSTYFTDIRHGGPIITVGLGTSLLWGWLLGRFWTSDRLGKH